LGTFIDASNVSRGVYLIRVVIGFINLNSHLYTRGNQVNASDEYMFFCC